MSMSSAAPDVAINEHGLVVLMILPWRLVNTGACAYYGQLLLVNAQLYGDCNISRWFSAGRC